MSPNRRFHKRDGRLVQARTTPLVYGDIDRERERLTCMPSCKARINQAKHANQSIINHAMQGRKEITICNVDRRPDWARAVWRRPRSCAVPAAVCREGRTRRRPAVAAAQFGGALRSNCRRKSLQFPEAQGGAERGSFSSRVAAQSDVGRRKTKGFTSRSAGAGSVTRERGVGRSDLLRKEILYFFSFFQFSLHTCFQL